MRNLPDITSDENISMPSTLNWVGMEEIAVPLTIKNQRGTLQGVSAKANVFVNITKPETKGIHMSRLYRIINMLGEDEFSKTNVDNFLDEIIASQNGLSDSAKIELAFDLLLKKPALISHEFGYQTYPFVVTIEKLDDKSSSEISFTIPYSSTCPCSASLSQQLYAEAIDQKFPTDHINKSELLDWIQSERGSVATPHSQRSYAYIRLQLNEDKWPDFPSLIFQFEEVIGTAVQTAVKRADEQAFAKLNAENLMFCEDAARRIKFAIEAMKNIRKYWFKVEHQESLHAHNAIAIDQSNS